MLPTEDKRERILFVGEGNFSFSRTFLRKVLALGHEKNYQIVSTSFDSVDKVVEKYPESPPILNEMNRHLDIVELKHDINSIYLSHHFPPNYFQHIFFNFPHLGYEDINRHQSFVAHFLSSCREVLSEDGIVYVALAATQEVGWKLTETATRLGYHLEDSIAIIESDWVGYDFRRHQSGKSFKQRVGPCFHYCFRKSTAVASTSAASVSNVLRIVSIMTTVPPAAITAAATSSTDAAQEAQQQDSNSTNKPRKKRRRVQELTDNRFHESINAEDGALCFVCNDCSRSFASELNARTHVYSVHILSPPSSSSSAGGGRGGDVEHVCADCDGRRFPNEEALHQHRIAKHRLTTAEVAVFDEAAIKEEVTPVAAETFPCPVCNWPIVDMQSHLDMFSPRDKECTMPCPHCQRLFADERSLTQHAAFCSLARSNTGEADNNS